MTRQQTTNPDIDEAHVDAIDVEGDTVAYEIEKGAVKLRRATPLDLAYARAVESTLTEWDSPADDRAYRDI